MRSESWPTNQVLIYFLMNTRKKCPQTWTVLQACAKSVNSTIEKIFLATTDRIHSLVLTLILHNSRTELHCGRVSRQSTLPTPLWPASLPSPAAFMFCPSNPQWNVPIPETSPSLEVTFVCYVNLCVSMFYILRSFFFFHHLLPAL